MPRRTMPIAMRGGLDIVSSPLTVAPGAMWTGLNYECVESGYRRMLGYERVDGRPAPSEAEYWMLARTLASTDTEASVGDTITGGTSGATGKVLAVAGNDYVVGRHDDATAFESAEALTNQDSTAVGSVSGVARRLGAGTIDLDEDYRHLAYMDRRADIAAVPGSGPVRGVWFYRNALYAVRDNADATAGVMHRATPSGWTAVTAFTLPAGGRYEFLNRNFTGQSAGLHMYGVNGVGKAFRWDGTDFAELSTGQTDDRPTHIAHHRNHLLLSYRGGSLIVSGTGLPEDYTAANGAAEIAGGQEIFGLHRVAAGQTMIMGSDHMSVLYGDDAGNFEVVDHSDEQTGGVEWTVQSIGAPLYMDNRGVRRFDTTERYGNFVINTMTTSIQPWIRLQREQKNNTTASMRVRASDQYRVFFESRIGLVIYLGRGQPEMSLIDYGVKVMCTCSTEDSDRIERVYFGDDEGMVYEAERGRSFDGNEIEAYVRMPLNHTGSPARNKRFFKGDLHLDLQARVKLSMSALFDDGLSPDQRTVEREMYGGGGLWNEALWDEFYWSSPLNGYAEFDLEGEGRNVSILFLSRTNREIPHTLNGIVVHYSPRRLER